ncbi:hypothetical protein EMCRGX_G011738 [Ephydatia muelleri]
MAGSLDDRRSRRKYFEPWYTDQGDIYSSTVVNLSDFRQLLNIAKQKQQYDAKHARATTFEIGVKVVKKDFLRKKREENWTQNGLLQILLTVNGAHLKMFHPLNTSHHVVICHLISPYLITPDSPHLITPDSPHLITPDSPHLITPDSPHLITPDSPHLITPDSPHLITPDSPHLITPDSPHLITLDSPHLITLDSPPSSLCPHLITLDSPPSSLWSVLPHHSGQSSLITLVSPHLITLVSPPSSLQTVLPHHSGQSSLIIPDSPHLITLDSPHLITPDSPHLITLVSPHLITLVSPPSSLWSVLPHHSGQSSHHSRQSSLITLVSPHLITLVSPHLINQNAPRQCPLPMFLLGLNPLVLIVQMDSVEISRKDVLAQAVTPGKGLQSVMSSRGN